jgi:prepilin-type N-terminal cleavage/methylation domain-containing protein
MNKNKSRSKGFTLVEILVAMVVLAIGLLGMAAMTILVMKGSRGASDLTAATNICQLKMEELKDVDWATLGTAAPSDLSNGALWGFANGALMQEMNLNSQGLGAGDGPFKFTRTFVICKGDDYTGTLLAPIIPTGTGVMVTPGPNEPPQAPDCKVNPSVNTTRVQWLACDPNDITSPPPPATPVPVVPGTNPEKKIKVLCTWKSRDGECHSVHIDTTVVKLGS